MPKTGPKPKTAQQKKARGTSQKCRETKGNVVAIGIVQDVADLPQPPAWFTDLEEEWKPRKFKIASDTFDKICGQLFAAQVLSTVHVDALATLSCVQAEVAIDLQQGNVTAAMLTQLRTMYSEFGLTPAAAKGVAPMQPPVGAENKHANNQRRKS